MRYRSAMRRVCLPLLLTTLALAQAPTEPADKAAAAATKLGDTGLAMVLPPGWEPGDAKAAGTRFLAVRAAGDTDGSSFNVTDGPPKLEGPVDPEAVRVELTGMLEKLLNEYAFVEDGTRSVLGKDCYWISSTFENASDAMRNLQVLVGSEPAFWLTFTTTTAAFAEYRKEIDAALATLTQVGEGKAAERVEVRKVGARLHVHGFSFEPPAGWEQGDAALALNALLFAHGPAEAGFSPNVNVRATPAMSRLDVATTTKEIKAALAGALPEGKVLDVAPVKLGGRQCLRTRATYKAAVRELSMVQYLVPGEPESFVVTYTTSKETAAALAKAIEKSAATIRIEGAAAAKSVGGKGDNN